MAQQNGDSPSKSGIVVFVATTTLAVQDADDVASTPTRTSATSPTDIFWAQTPISSTQDPMPHSTHTQSVSTRSASHGSNAPVSTGYRGQENNDERENSDSQHTGHGHRNTIIIASVTTIVGALIIALILLIFLRRRKCSTYSKIMRFRPGSTGITALPVYQPESDAARSTGPGASVMQETRSNTARSQFTASRKSLIPPKASATNSEQISRGSTEQAIGMSQSNSGLNRPSALSLPPMRQTDVIAHGHIGLSKRSLSSLPTEKGLSSPLDSPDARWSWTNSQAPSTPRIAPPNTRPSLLSSHRSVRSVTSWFRGQEGEDRPPSRRSHRRKRSNPLLLKNQALRPVLAPRPTVKRPATSLSSRAGRLSVTLPSGRRSNASHRTHRTEDQRPLTPLARPMSRLSG